MRWLELLASGLFAYEVTGSALAATAVVAARQLPQLLFGAFAGAISEAVEPQDHRHAGADRAGRRLDGAGHARHHGPARAVARGAGQPGVGHDVGDRDVDPAAHGGRGRRAASHRAGDRARFGDQRRHPHGRPAAGRHRLRMAGHEGRLHLHRPGPVRRRLRTGGPRPSADRRAASTSRASRPRSPRAWPSPGPSRTILLVCGITVVTNAFAFAYSGLVAPLGLSAFHVSPALVGLLAAGRADRRAGSAAR